MPIFVFKHEWCGREWEIIRPADAPLPECPVCHTVQHVVKLPSAPAIQFKGGGWAADGYSRKAK